MNHKHYDEEPVEYCKSCGDLYLIELSENEILCMNCGCKNFTSRTSIEKYLEEYGEHRRAGDSLSA